MTVRSVLVAVGLVAASAASAHADATFRVIEPSPAATLGLALDLTRDGEFYCDVDGILRRGNTLMAIDQVMIGATAFQSFGQDVDGDGYGEPAEGISPGDPRSFSSVRHLGTPGMSGSGNVTAATSTLELHLRPRGNVVSMEFVDADPTRQGFQAHVYEHATKSCVQLRERRLDPTSGLISDHFYLMGLGVEIPLEVLAGAEVVFTSTTTTPGTSLELTWSLVRDAAASPPAIVDLSAYSIGWNIEIPTPSSAAVLALGGLVAARRSRPGPWTARRT